MRPAVRRLAGPASVLEGEFLGEKGRLTLQALGPGPPCTGSAPGPGHGRGGERQSLEDTSADDSGPGARERKGSDSGHRSKTRLLAPTPSSSSHHCSRVGPPNSRSAARGGRLVCPRRPARASETRWTPTPGWVVPGNHRFEWPNSRGEGQPPTKGSLICEASSRPEDTRLA